MKKNLTEGKDKVENEPKVDHFDVGSDGQWGGDVDEHGGEDQHDSEVHCHHRLKKVKYKASILQVN